MASSPLFLVSIKASSASLEARSALWSFIVDLSREQGADSFSIEAVEWSRPTVAALKKGLRALLALPADEEGLRPLDDFVPLIIELGPKVMSLNLYANKGWVAGASDWGDNFDVLFEQESWLRLKPIISSCTPPVQYDVAEAEARPPPLLGR